MEAVKLLVPTSQKCPAGHAKQDPCPTRSEYFPEGHCDGSPLPEGQKLPEGQIPPNSPFGGFGVDAPRRVVGLVGKIKKGRRPGFWFQEEEEGKKGEGPKKDEALKEPPPAAQAMVQACSAVVEGGKGEAVLKL